MNLREPIVCTHICGIALWRCAIPTAPERGLRRDMERRAVARLVAAAFGPHAQLLHRDSGAPYIAMLDGSPAVEVSVSHCDDTAMLAVSRFTAIGLDCERFRPQLSRVLPRVCSPHEVAEWGASDELMLRAWTIKEAVYKAAGIQGLEFAEGIHLPHPADRLNPEKYIAQTADGRRWRLIDIPLHNNAGGTPPATTIAISL